MLLIKIPIASQVDRAVNLLRYNLRETAANQQIMRCLTKIQVLIFIFLRSYSTVGVAPVAWQPLPVAATTLTRAIGSKICTFHLIYLSKEPMNMNSKNDLLIP